MNSKSSFRTRSMAAAAVALLLVAGTSPVFAETVDTLKKSFDVTAGGRLVVEVDIGSIEVRTSSDRSVAIEVVRKFRASSEEKEREALAAHEVTIEQSGNDVTVRAYGERSHNSIWSWLGGRGVNRQAQFIITVPEKYNAELKTSGGAITVNALHGELVAHTSGGPLKFSRIEGPVNGGTSGGPIEIAECKGDVEVHTSGGGISVRGCRGNYRVATSGGPISVDGHVGRMAAKTSGGGISIARIDGSVDASTSGGSVEATFVSPPTGDCRLHTSGGGISVSIPAHAAFTLDAHTSGGGVHCDLAGATDMEKSRGTLRASYNGGGARLELSSSGGGIRVEPIHGTRVES